MTDISMSEANNSTEITPTAANNSQKTETELEPHSAAPDAVVKGEERKRKLHEDNEEQAKRSKRLFGFLKGTLEKNKEEAGPSGTLTKRQELEQRLAEKLRRERRELADKNAKEKEDKLAELVAQRSLDQERRDAEAVSFVNAVFIPSKAQKILVTLPYD